MTENDLIRAIRDAMQHASEDDEGMTFNELLKETGISDARLRSELNQLIRDKKAVVYKAPRLNILGDRQRVPVYRLVTSGAD